MRAHARPGRLRAHRRRSLITGFVALVVVATMAMTGSANADDGGVSDRPILGIWEVQSLSGRNNNLNHRTWGEQNRDYLRVAPTRYVDGKSKPFGGPNSRYVSNREFNDTHVNVFSERGVTQWGFAWGQFLDHTFGLRLGRAPNDPTGETANIPFNPNDPIEEFTNTLGHIPFERSARSPGSGITNPRQQVNTVSSYIDAFTLYGGSDTRLDWLREGSLDGNPDNNGARLLMPGNYLPRRDARGSPSAAPVMEVDGRLLANPNRAAVAGDIRANENIALTAQHTLFAREHNRIVSLLPRWVSQQDKFQIARAVVIAEQQYITYNEFLPALGVSLPSYRGYNPNANATLGNEFATVGYRAHSMIHGEIEMETNVSRYSQATLDALEALGVELTVEGDEVEVAVPLNVGFFNPDLVQQVQLGPLLQGLGLEPQYNNESEIDNQLRSVLFQVPVTGNPECLDGDTLPECFRGVIDLGAIDIERGRDHGMPTYNQMRRAYGLAPKTSFKAITGEPTESFPAGSGIDNPNILDVLEFFDIDGNPTNLDNDDAVRIVRRATVAARLKAIYGGDINKVDAFVGMIAERHLPGREFGELQLAIWAKQYQALRDGDRFFYANDPLQPFIKRNFGIDFRTTLGDVIARNTDIPRDELAPNVFFGQEEEAAAALAAPGASDANEVQPGNIARKNSGGQAVSNGHTLSMAVLSGAGIVAVTGRTGHRRPNRRARRASTVP